MTRASDLPLFGFQAEDVAKLSGVYGGLDGSDMGSGKTYKGIALDLNHREEIATTRFKGAATLVIAPLAVLDMWVAKYNELAPELRTYRINPKSKKTREEIYKADADVYVVHWDCLRLLPDLARAQFGHVIADECHRGQNRKAQQTTALKRIKPMFRLGLSGTPVTSRPEKFCSILNWLYPKDRRFTSYWRFFANHVDTHEEYKADGTPYTVIDGYKNLDELVEYISPFYVRHLKKTQCCPHHPEGVTPELPEKYYSEMTVDLSPDQRRAFDEMKKDMIAWVGANKNSPLIAPIAVAKLRRLEQFASAYADVKVINNEQIVTLTEPSSKLDAVMQMLDDNPDEQVIIFSQFRQMIDLLEARLAKKGISYVVLTGKTPQINRSRIVADFQAGNARVFAGTIDAGGVGITLTAASTVVMLDRKRGVPTLNFQAEDRAWRIGQKNAVQVIDVVARNTVERDRARKLGITWDWLQKIFGDKG